MGKGSLSSPAHPRTSLEDRDVEELGSHTPETSEMIATEVQTKVYSKLLVLSLFGEDVSSNKFIRQNVHVQITAKLCFKAYPLSIVWTPALT